MTTLFAKPRHHYESYADLYALIDLSGFETCYIDEIDPQSDNAYIITILNGEVPEAGYPDAHAKIVLWDLEYHLEGFPRLENIEIWAADQWYAEQIGAKYVPMGSHYGLALNTACTPLSMHDVAYLGYMIPRRQRIHHELQQAGVKVSPTSAWGEERHCIINNSKSYLHVHQHEHVRTIAPLRMVVAAAYGRGVITEAVTDPGVFQQFIDQVEYEQIARHVHDTFVNPDEAVNINKRKLVVDIGAALFWFLCRDYTFRKSVEAGLS